MTFDEWRLSQAENRRVEEFVHALRTPCAVHRNEDSFFNTVDFEEDFRSRLLTQHAFLGSPLFQESFEAAFIGAAQAAGHSILKADDGQRFWDLELMGRRISLKSTKARNLRDSTLHISKLTEAAWIQDCRDATRRRDETFGLFREYIANVHSIIQLRYFAQHKRYELVEVPVTLFQEVFNVDRRHFNADGPTINIPIGKDPPDFTLKLDRSDAKITIANINKSLCVVHGTWEVGVS